MGGRRNKMKIEFGCGETPRHPEFKTCDVRDVPGVDFVCPAWEIDKKVAENTVDEIFSRHFEVKCGSSLWRRQKSFHIQTCIRPSYTIKCAKQYSKNFKGYISLLLFCCFE